MIPLLLVRVVKLVAVALVEVLPVGAALGEVPPAGAALVVVRVLLILRLVVVQPQMEVGMEEPPKREVCINRKQYKIIIISKL
jgi:hypothetical protein